MMIFSDGTQYRHVAPPTAVQTPRCVPSSRSTALTYNERNRRGGWKMDRRHGVGEELTPDKTTYRCGQLPRGKSCAGRAPAQNVVRGAAVMGVY